MALIQCSNCGNQISDSENYCPYCGASIDQTLQAGSHAIHGRNNKVRWILIAILAALALGIGGWLLHDSKIKRAEQERQMAEKAEQARRDSIVNVQLQELARLDSIQKNFENQRVDNIRNAYIHVLNSCRSKYPGADTRSCGYFLYDINGDSIPELWVSYGKGDEDRNLNIYTYNGGPTLLYKSAYGHCRSYLGKDYILIVMTHLGHAEWFMFSCVEGKMNVRSVFSEDSIESTDKYTKPTEPIMGEYPCSNYEPIKALVN